MKVNLLLLKEEPFIRHVEGIYLVVLETSYGFQAAVICYISFIKPFSSNSPQTLCFL